MVPVPTILRPVAGLKFEIILCIKLYNFSVKTFMLSVFDCESNIGRVI